MPSANCRMTPSERASTCSGSWGYTAWRWTINGHWRWRCPRRDWNTSEVEIPITYDGQVVTRRRVDFVVWNGEGELILETKARSQILDEDVEQCLLYLHQGKYRVCLLVNFGQKPLGIRRFVHTPSEVDK